MGGDEQPMSHGPDSICGPPRQHLFSMLVTRLTPHDLTPKMMAEVAALS